MSFKFNIPPHKMPAAHQAKEAIRKARGVPPDEVALAEVPLMLALLKWFMTLTRDMTCEQGSPLDKNRRATQALLDRMKGA